jgi:hypothetical protein
VKRLKPAKACFGRPELAGTHDCDACHRYLRLACSLEQECVMLALDHVMDAYDVRDQADIDRRTAAFREEIRRRMQL